MTGRVAGRNGRYDENVDSREWMKEGVVVR